jgi:hypothetical protein
VAGIDRGSFGILPCGLHILTGLILRESTGGSESGGKRKRTKR